MKGIKNQLYKSKRRLEQIFYGESGEILARELRGLRAVLRYINESDDISIEIKKEISDIIDKYNS